MNCQICSSVTLSATDEMYALPTVTSDCRPWVSGKSVTICSGCGVMRRVLRPENEEIYGKVYTDYTSYPEPDGRTQKILEFLKDKMPIPESVLDIGTGTGYGMGILLRQFPNALVCGYEPTIHSKRPNLQKFDLITLFHVFEHVEDLHEMLAYVKSTLTDGGHALIQVPYAVMWPFDLVIADHIWHFTMTSLAELLNKHGLQIAYIGNDVLKKEITLLAKKGETLSFIDVERFTHDPINYILGYKSFLDSISERVAIFGTGPAAAWAGNILQDRVAYYLDDDKSRHGSFNGISVYPPLANSLRVVAPFPEWQLEEIKKIHWELNFL